jgi:hypothetical protein
MVIGSRHALKRANDIEIYFDNEILDVVTTFHYLGVRISNILSWEQHVSRICQRLYPSLAYSIAIIISTFRNFTRI